MYNNHIGKNVFFAHNGLGCVISKEATIGDDCTIYQNVTIGAGRGGYTTIGNNVVIYANAVICGKITIGDNAIIGACSFVNSNVPSDTTYAGNPAKEINKYR